ncbi:hypothetical protein TARUN_8769 [Trichoderma arundinaceum]|uniref:Uncharacterized protein n=1 Tax=Trichoderma arundinaceum TaxID=490622 RepID=A0A395NC17_TRIAR|nr:hypothetical protein TARUN_8769 [Trichoderma arundinaceum]
MTATPPLVTSDLLGPSESSAAPHMNETREGIASVISTIRAQIAEPATGPVSHQPGITPQVHAPGAPAGLSPNEMSAPSPLERSTSASSVSNGLAANVTEQGDSVSHSNHSKEQHEVSAQPSEMVPKVVDRQGLGSRNSTPGSSAPPKTIQSEEKSKAYMAFTEMVQKTDASVIRQVVRENWHKCLVGSDYHTAFIANAAITCCNPEVLRRTVQEIGDRVIKTSKREIAKHFGSQDLDEVADLIGPKLGAQFQDRVMATRLETIGAQELINALARAERLGYHVNDIVEKKKSGLGGEVVIPSMSAVPHPHPPMPPHHIQGDGPPPPMPPHQGQGCPQQSQPYGAPPSQIPVAGLPTKVFVPQTPSVAIPSGGQDQYASGVLPGIEYCQKCHRPCSSLDALTYCQSPKTQENTLVDTCVHCGCQFESTGGLSYHTKSNVCGHHDDKRRMQMVGLLQKIALNPTPSTQGPPIQQMTPGQPVTVAPTPKSNATPRQKVASSVATPGSSGNDPYAKLTPEERANFEAEMKSVDQYYVGLMNRAAVELPPGQREEEIAKLKNRYNTKQSNTRKKYGIRLRERRTNAEMGASRNTSPADYARASKKVRVDGRQARAAQGTDQVLESPRRRVPLSEMGGLSASSATAELVDPTVSSMASQPPLPAHNVSAVPTVAAQGVPQGAHQGTSNDPMQIDDDSSTDADSDNVDIPARIKTT